MTFLAPPSGWHPTKTIFVARFKKTLKSATKKLVGCHPLEGVTRGGPPSPARLVTPLNRSSVAFCLNVFARDKVLINKYRFRFNIIVILYVPRNVRAVEQFIYSYTKVFSIYYLKCVSRIACAAECVLVCVQRCLCCFAATRTTPTTRGLSQFLACFVCRSERSARYMKRSTTAFQILSTSGFHGSAVEVSNYHHSQLAFTRSCETTDVLVLLLSFSDSRPLVSHTAEQRPVKKRFGPGLSW